MDLSSQHAPVIIMQGYLISLLHPFSRDVIYEIRQVKEICNTKLGMEKETMHTYFLHISLKMSAEATSYMWFIYSDNRKIITNDEVIKLPANKSYT